MKSIILFLMLFTYVPYCWAKVSDKTYIEHIQQFQDLIRHDDAETLAKYIKYPLRRAYPLKPVNNSSEFIARYGDIFDSEQKELILSVNPTSDFYDPTYGKIGWYKSIEDTLMLKRAMIASFVDMDLSGNLINLILSKSESDKQANAFDGFAMPDELQNFSRVVQIIQTKKFLVRIDVVDGKYRYISWSSGKQTTDTPDLVLYNGVNNSIGGMIDPMNEYVFNNGKYKYIIENILEMGVNGDILHTELKVIGPNKKVILSEHGKLIYNDDLY